MKKGFTLIELLAVIIILAVIALIATPIVMDIIDDSKESGNRSSVVMYADAIELQVTTDWFKHVSYPKVNKTWVDINVEYSGNRVTCEEIYYDTANGVLLHKCTVGNDVSMLDNVRVYAEDKVYCYYKKQINDKCEDDATYMASYNAVKTNTPLATTYKDNSGANAPDLLDNMVPVKYENNNWIVADINQKWYDYDAKEWANAVVLNSGITKNVGDTLNVATDVSQMYVWIPRYTYIIFNGEATPKSNFNPEPINIHFETGTTSSGTVTCNDAITSYTTNNTSNKSETCVDKNGTIVNGISTYTHPAFCLGTRTDGVCDGEELTGIWVGKFETGSTIMNSCTSTTSSVNTNCDVKSGSIQIKPNVKAWTGARVGTYYTAIQNMKTTNNDTHMMKNIEWGATAYLTNSIYGRCVGTGCTEVSINNSTNMKSGRSAGKPGKSSTTTSTEGTYTYDGYLATDISKTGTQDLTKIASTTGNVYGIYDMSGGANEYVMGNSATNTTNPYIGYASTHNSGFKGNLQDGTIVSSGYDLNLKYTDMYSYNSYNSALPYGNVDHSRGKLGDATKETLIIYGNTVGGWYGDETLLVYSNSIWFVRGGTYNNGISSGILSFSYHNGIAFQFNTARVVISRKSIN